MSLLLRVALFSRRSRRHPSSRLSSRWHWTLSAAAWSRAWRGRAATSPACLSSQSIFLVSDFELLREVVPGLRKLGILANVAYPAAVVEMGQVQTTARSLDFEVATLEIRRSEDIGPAFEAIKDHADGLYVVPDPLVITHRVSISNLALDARLATVSFVREYVEAGALMSYGPNYSDLFRKAADYVDKILHGTKPGDLPVQQPTKFELVINLKTAKAIGLKIPESFLLRADAVIE